VHFVRRQDIPIFVNDVDQEANAARDWAETLGNPLSVSARHIVVGQINTVRIAHRPAIPNIKSISGHFASQPSDAFNRSTMQPSHVARLVPGHTKTKTPTAGDPAGAEKLL
jgi:hypothetical protein